VNKFLEAEEQNFSLFNYGTSHTVLCASHAGLLRWQLLVAWRLMHCVVRLGNSSLAVTQLNVSGVNMYSCAYGEP
jgi:hypothetical protein